ncbi:MAG: hypothetical protein AB8B56_18850 [Crocinitomicaceae bacterium]
MKDDIWKKEVRKKTRILGIWTFLWVVSMALASFGPNILWKDNSVLTILAIILNASVGIGMIIANIRQLNSLDELQKKIQMEAMGLALGVGVVGGLSYSLLDITNLMETSQEISIMVVMISVTYMVTLIIGQFRYK